MVIIYDKLVIGDNLDDGDVLFCWMKWAEYDFFMIVLIDYNVVDNDDHDEEQDDDDDDDNDDEWF